MPSRASLYGLFLAEHMERIRRNAGMLLMRDLPTTDALVQLVIETASRNGLSEDLYLRPCFYKSSRTVGVRLHHLEHDLVIFAVPFGNYVDTEKGVRLMTSTWRRNADDALPARGKIVGGYVNMAFQKTEAELNGFDEALVLTADGHASEASAANMFVVRDGVLLTPPVSDDILEGVTRRGMMELAQSSVSRGGPVDRPIGDLRGRRDVPVRHGRPDLPGHRARPSTGRIRLRRSDHAPDARGVFRRGPGTNAGLRSLGDPDPNRWLRPSPR